MAVAGVSIVIIVAMAIVAIIIDDDNDIETPGCFQTLVSNSAIPTN